VYVAAGNGVPVFLKGRGCSSFLKRQILRGKKKPAG
jgi:hypothetical protein